MEDQLIDDNNISEIVAQILLDQKGLLEKIQSGDKIAFDFLLSETIKKSQGRMNPAYIEILLKQLFLI